MNGQTPRYIVTPPISAIWLNWFYRYAAFYLSRNFHTFSLLRTGQPDLVKGWPLLVCLNHPSWWDPLTAFYLSRRFYADRRQYAPIAATGLTKYRFFSRLGFFGIDLNTYTGASTFLKIGQAALSQPDGALWITPQGRFRDVRERPVSIESGIGHLAHLSPRFAMLPLALEYAFWNERFPEAFACFGRPLMVENGRAKSPDEWTRTFASALESTQEKLSEAVKPRDSRVFEPLIEGKAGVGGAYDLWRSTKARIRGRKFDPEHGSA
jgi:1-acyl-sn-glycerol-3-phosphate acyltransferase